MSEVVSNAGHFISYPASAGGGGGAIQLTKVMKADVKDDRDLEVVKAIGVKQGAGFRESQGGGEITLTKYRETGAPEVDYHRLLRDRVVFTYTIADEDGGRRESFRCRVAKIDSSGDEGGKHEETITLKYTKRYIA
jgi:hypothetical protein